MTPREQLRKMTALGEQGALDEKHWYRLVNGMSANDLRQRQEMIMRNQMAMAPQILAQGQQRLQGVPTPFEPRFMERELVPPAEMVAPDGRPVHLGPHLGPPLAPHAAVLPGRNFPGAAGYGFLPSEPMETVARRQELIHKQNMARIEMNAILHQKELENAHQKGMMGMENPMSYPPNPMAFRGRQRMPEAHDVFVHRPTLDDLHSNSILMSTSPYPPIGSLHRERGRRVGRRPTAHKSADHPVGHVKGPAEDKSVERSPGCVSGGEEKEVEVKGDVGEECSAGKTPHQAKAESETAAGGRKCYKEGEANLRKGGAPDQCPDASSSSVANDKDAPNQCGAFQEKFMFPSGGMPYMFPVGGNGFLPPAPPNLFLNGDEVSEDIRKWSVNDVCNFISNIPTCSEYAQTFKDHMIDGETLPLLSEEHLLDTLGLKLGPALKIRSQAAPDKPGDRSSEMGSPVNCNSEEMMMMAAAASPREPADVLKPADHLGEPGNNSPRAKELSAEHV
ncbi:sterile alpha motif domain-containing protein 7 isoform X2 [Syngnathoides biaculeatus]|uniref:sterile alpha motif domain-containing protein 7 isoform X2 n=1 Tax=Syngnathoides biaculeatus TaxID=300417 RepID=UPI002ADD8DA7|nr:sterile alpha motif domain-containing protein 7 isoform X2 [Syngnathoides biaculeatus]